MLRLGKLTDYAMLIMGQMARQPDIVLSATSLAEILHLSPPTVSKVLKILAEAKLVGSVRGLMGGYKLLHSASTITVADIIIAMEGAVTMTECCNNANLCALNTRCTMRDNWREINKLIQIMLAQFTLTDMLKPLAKGQRMIENMVEGLAHE